MVQLASNIIVLSFNLDGILRLCKHSIHENVTWPMKMLQMTLSQIHVRLTSM